MRLQEKTGATVYVALDVPDLTTAQAIITDLGPPHGYGIKLGLELCTAVGLPQLLQALDPRIPKFIDLKLNDIPNTVANTVHILSQMGAKIINLHAACGEKAMKAAAAVKGDALLFAVTALTSLTDYDCECIFGATANKVVNRFAMMAVDSGIDGLICSAKDLQNHDLPKTLMYLTPGIRPTWAATNDQARITTPHDAIQLGADGIVIGRPITNPPDGLTRAEALQKILIEIQLAHQFKADRKCATP
jgi:orotidine-5'-phosphate decarboxylase